jgi:hypothetical protein
MGKEIQERRLLVRGEPPVIHQDAVVIAGPDHAGDLLGMGLIDRGAGEQGGEGRGVRRAAGKVVPDQQPGDEAPLGVRRWEGLDISHQPAAQPQGHPRHAHLAHHLQRPGIRGDPGFLNSAEGRHRDLSGGDDHVARRAGSLPGQKAVGLLQLAPDPEPLLPGPAPYVGRRPGLHSLRDVNGHPKGKRRLAAETHRVIGACGFQRRRQTGQGLPERAIRLRERLDGGPEGLRGIGRGHPEGWQLEGLSGGGCLASRAGGAGRQADAGQGQQGQADQPDDPSPQGDARSGTCDRHRNRPP